MIFLAYSFESSIGNPYWRYFWDKLVEGGFPRDVSLKRYPRTMSKTSYYNYIRASLIKKESAYVEFYSDEQKDSRVLDRVLIDVDYEKVKYFDLHLLDREWNLIRVFCRYFWDYIDLYFSGKKGFHITLYTEPFKVDAKTKRVLREWVRAWLGDPLLLDTSGFLDLRRVISVPMTYHSKTGLLVIPVRFDMNLDEILLASSNPTDEYLKQFMGSKKRWDITNLPCICEFL